jgi:hypothetical protein
VGDIDANAPLDASIHSSILGSHSSVTLARTADCSAVRPASQMMLQPCSEMRASFAAPSTAAVSAGGSTG